MNKVTVVGEGAFGTAIAKLLAECDLQVYLWCHDQQVVQTITDECINYRYMPHTILPKTIIPTHDITHALHGSSLILVTTPVKFLRSILESARHAYHAQQVWIVLCKGIEQETLMLPTQVVQDVFGSECLTATMMGPSFAQELVAQQPTQITVASEYQEITTLLQELITTPYFSMSTSSDPLGVQLCAAYKNIIALGAGILEGAGYGENTRALLVTRGLYEMATLVEAIGGKSQTAFSVAALGDVLLTSYGKLSRNRMVGHRLGKGETLEYILQETGVIPEGINTLQALFALSTETGIALPLGMLLHTIIFNNGSVSELIDELMATEQN